MTTNLVVTDEKDEMSGENHSGYYQEPTCGTAMSDRQHASHACYRDPRHADYGRRDDNAHVCLCGTVWADR